MSADSSSPSGLPGRSRPQLSELSRETTEDDLWNLDEEAPVVKAKTPSPPPAAKPAATVVPTDDPPEAAPPQPAPEPKQPRLDRRDVVDEIGDLDEWDDAEPAAPAVTITALQELPPAPEPVVATPDVEDTTEDTTEEAAPDEAPAESPVPQPQEKKENRIKPEAAGDSLRRTLPRPRLNRREVIGIASFALVMLITVIWMLGNFFRHLSFRDDPHAKPDFPLKGEQAQVASASTFWRNPIREGENRDVARREINWIPVIEVTLSPDGSPAGALRVIFRNSEGTPVGDPITRVFSAGRFEASGNETISFSATDGFEQDGDFQAYRTGNRDPWTVELLEGPSANSPAGSFKKLASVPLLPLRR